MEDKITSKFRQRTSHRVVEKTEPDLIDKVAFDSRENNWLELVILVENSLRIMDMVRETYLGYARPFTQASVRNIQIYEAYHSGIEFKLHYDKYKWVYHVASYEKDFEREWWANFQSDEYERPS